MPDTAPRDLAGKLIAFLETGAPPDGLFAPATAAPRRCRLAAALARAWVYGGYPERSRVFAREAADLASSTGDPRLVADAPGA